MLPPMKILTDITHNFSNSVQSTQSYIYDVFFNFLIVEIFFFILKR